MTLTLLAIPVGILAAIAVHSWVLRRRTSRRIRQL